MQNCFFTKIHCLFLSRHAEHKSVTCDDNGEVHITYTDNKLKLHGKHSIIGRSFVVSTL